MLVLTRKIGGRVRLRVGDVVAWVSVKSIEGRQVKLAFEGDVEILREEIIEDKDVYEEADEVPL